MTIELPMGFTFAAVTCGIKASGKPDLSLCRSDPPAQAVGLFTTNQIQAAPVRYCRALLPSRQIAAVVVNSGNANACTGQQGEQAAAQMAQYTEQLLGLPAQSVLVCSTGVIGHQLPMDRVRAGIDGAVRTLASGTEALTAAATAILTTDTRTKLVTRTLTCADGTVRILGVAKGAAMIGPNLATMLAFLYTDAQLEASQMDSLLRQAADKSFHCIHVDGHTSTNDTVLFLANGASGVPTLAGNELDAFSAELCQLCEQLARAIVEDGEGTSHVIEVHITGAPDDLAARQVAQAVAASPLVKAAICGRDPNWGRICSAAGYSGLTFQETDLSLLINGVTVYEAGTPQLFDREQLRQSMTDKYVHLELRFTLGTGQCQFWTTDLTPEYVRLNSDYTT